MGRPFVSIIVAVFLIALSGCAPRGETRSLDEIYESSKKRFDRSLSESSAEVKERLDTLAQSLQDFKSEGDWQRANSISAELLALTGMAGFTSRAALTEIQKQYLFLAQQEGGGETSVAQRKLLAARTFSVLAQELETTAFQVRVSPELSA